MKTLKNVVLGALFAGGMAMAANTGTVEDQVIHQIRLYPHYSIFDNIKIQIDGSNVELLGQVSEPYKKSDLQRIVARTAGVTTVTNDLEVLPLSNFDNRIRGQVARAIYRDPVLSRYALQSVAPIHIIVDNGHVTLEGVVSTEMEKEVAGIRASGASLSFGPVVNNLRVENPSPKHVS